MHGLHFRVREDASRVLYPPVSSVPFLPERWSPTIETVSTIDRKVDIVQIAGNDTNTFVYKKVERLFMNRRILRLSCKRWKIYNVVAVSNMWCSLLQLWCRGILTRHRRLRQ